MYGSMEESTPAAAPALGPEEIKFVRKLMATNGDDARSAGLSHESQESSGSTLPTLATQALSTSTLAKLDSFDVGVKSMSAEEIRTILSPAVPTNCTTASTGACLEPAWDGSGGLIVDTDCCAPCGEGECAPGYTYAGQILFDSEMLSSTYPDFYPFCGEAGGCGNTCCVPSDEWDGARAAAGD